METDLVKQDEAQLIARFSRIPLEKRELLVSLILRKLGCDEDRKIVSRFLYMLFLKADLVKKYRSQ